MPTIKEIDKCLSQVAPRELSESWDNDGVMLCKNDESDVKKVLISLDITDSVIDYAVCRGFDLILTHHPFIFNPLSNIIGDRYSQIEKLIKANISVISYHTRMDSSDIGVNACVAELLELDDIESFGGESGKIGRVGNLKQEMSPEEFGQYLKGKLGCGTIRASLTDKKIRRCALVGGSGKSFLADAKNTGADAFVTSEGTHNTFMDAVSAGISFYDCGHYYTENPVCNRFKDILESSFNKNLIVEIYNTGSPYINI